MILIKNKNGFISGKAFFVNDTFVEVCQKNGTSPIRRFLE